MEEETKKHLTMGTCGICGRKYTKTGMSRHLKSCWEKQADSKAAASGKKEREERVLLILVGIPDDSDYWLHLEVPAAAKLSVLDRFLKDTLEESGGHLSVFEIYDKSYYCSDAREMGGYSMDYEIGRLLAPGDEASYEYDAGESYNLTLNVLAERPGTTAGNSIRVLARNDPPQDLCDCSGKSAIASCIGCNRGGEARSCEGCL